MLANVWIYILKKYCTWCIHAQQRLTWTSISLCMYLQLHTNLKKNLRCDLLCEKRKRQFSIGKTKSEREQYSDVCYHLIFGCTISWIFAVHFWHYGSFTLSCSKTVIEEIGWLMRLANHLAILMVAIANNVKIADSDAEVTQHFLTPVLWPEFWLSERE